MCQRCPERAQCGAERARGKTTRFRWISNPDRTNVCDNFRHLTGHARSVLTDAWRKAHISDEQVRQISDTFASAALIFVVCFSLHCGDGRWRQFRAVGRPIVNMRGARTGTEGMTRLVSTDES